MKEGGWKIGIVNNMLEGIWYKSIRYRGEKPFAAKIQMRFF
jgi:hypothetical protein